MQRSQLEPYFFDGCRRLARKGFFASPADSFSMRIPGRTEMMLATGLEDWREIRNVDIHTVSLHTTEGVQGLHAAIYRQRADVGAVTMADRAHRLFLLLTSDFEISNPLYGLGSPLSKL